MAMGFWNNIFIVLLGFTVWTVIAPKLNSPKYGELFLAYMTALLFCLVASSDLLITKPIAFFFTVGGVFAFFYTVFRKTVRITIKKQ